MLQTGAGDRYYGDGFQYALAIPRTSAGVQAAIDKLAATGKPGVVVCSPMDYDFSEGGITPRHNVNLVGMPAMPPGVGDIPDSSLRITKGTRFVNGPGVISIRFNDIDQPALPPVGQLSATGLYNVAIEGVTSIGGAGLLRVGAANTMGMIKCRLNNIFYEDATGWGIELHNFMQCEFGNMTGRNTIKGGGIRYGCQLGSRVAPGNAVLIPGNSTWWGTSFIFNSHVSGRGYEWYARTTTDANQLNELHAQGAKFQVNRFIGSSVPPTINLQIAANDPDILVPSQAEYDLLIETGALSLTVSAPTGMGTTDTYFIVSKNDAAKTIRLQTSILPNSFVTPTSGGTFSALYGGPPGLCINFDTLSLMTSSHIGNYDIELQGNICSIYGRRIRSTVFSVAEMYNTGHRGAIVLRDSVVQGRFKLTDAVGYCNFDSNTHFDLVNETATGRALTAGFTLSKANHGNTYIINSVSDVNIVVPAGLNQRFWCRFIQKGAGKIIITQGANVTVPATLFSTSGPRAEIELRAVHGQSDQYDVFGMVA